MRMRMPVFLTGSPPCEAFSQLRHIGMAKRDPEQFKLQRETAERRLHIACRAYRRQYDAGRLFLHEHPDGADSWCDNEVKALEQLPGVYRVRGPMCHWEMLAEDRRGHHCGQSCYMRKLTGWLTNSKELAELLQKKCSNKMSTREWHRHVHLIGGLAKQAQKYPPALVTAVLKTLKSYLKNRGELSAFEQKAAGPVPDEQTFAKEDWQEFFEEDWATFVDDVHGTPLRADLVRAAREEELEMDS